MGDGPFLVVFDDCVENVQLYVAKIDPGQR